MKYLIVFVFVCLTLMAACDQPRSNQKIEKISSDHHLEKPLKKTDSLRDIKKVYVPVYSDIYQRTRQELTSLTSTLSIHNTSETDTLFITRIDYYNTEGELLKKYINAPIFLKTFETIAYVVEEDDNTGGSGANFVIEWYGDSKLNPLFQAVMIGGLGNKSFSFTTEGVEIK